MLRPSYKPLEILLIERDTNKEYLKNELRISPATLAKMSKGENVAMSVLLKICEHFDCQIQDVVQFVKTDEDGKGDEEGG